MTRTFFRKPINEKGFTLIELLVVITIIGTLSSIVIPRLVMFLGRGKVESANTEAHQVVLAVAAAMTEKNTALSLWDTIDSSLTGAVSDDVDPYDFMKMPTDLQATYYLDDTGCINNAIATEGGKWNGLSWGAQGWYQP